jgi:hypothetical protein
LVAHNKRRVALPILTVLRLRERVGVVVRDTTIERGVGNNNFLFEGSQALPASPSDKDEVEFTVN